MKYGLYSSSQYVQPMGRVCLVHVHFMSNIPSSSPYGVHFWYSERMPGLHVLGDQLSLHNAQPLGGFDNGLRKQEWHRQTMRQNSRVNLLPFYWVQEPCKTACLHGWGWFPQLGDAQRRKPHAGVKREKGKFWTWLSPLHLVALWLWTRY